MTKYLLADLEANGYDDSDFYAIFFDTSTGTIHSEMYGTTRGPSPRVAPTDVYLREIPSEIEEKALEIVEKRAFDEIKKRDRWEIDSPDSVNIGDSVTLLEPVSFKDKRSEEKKVVKAEPGESGVVIWQGCFERIYRNGYNRKGRSNTRIGIRFEDGRVVFTGLDRCKLSREYLSDEEIADRAQRYAATKPFAALYMGYR